MQLGGKAYQVCEALGFSTAMETKTPDSFHHVWINYTKRVVPGAEFLGLAV